MSETPRTMKAWIDFGQRSVRVSGRGPIIMLVRRDDMAELERELQQARAAIRDAIAYFEPDNNMLWREWEEKHRSAIERAEKHGG
jgi:hypothetical protein